MTGKVYVPFDREPNPWLKEQAEASQRRQQAQYNHLYGFYGASVPPKQEAPKAYQEAAKKERPAPPPPQDDGPPGWRGPNRRRPPAPPKEPELSWEWKVLGLAIGATLDDAKKAFRDLTKRYHPDTNGGSREHEQALLDVRSAFKSIKNKL